MTLQTRLTVIGAGPGGYVAAFRAADLGMAVTLVDEAPKPGGVCLYRGCMPSKALLHAARVVSEAREAERWGIAFGAPAIDPARLRAWKDEVVARLTGGLALLARQRGVACLRGRAAFADAQSLNVRPADAPAAGVSSRLAFDHAIIATGSRPARPGPLALDDPRVLDSTGALDIERVPKSLLVVGGGYIGLELGTVYAALGTAVTVVEMTGSLLPGVDADLVRVLARRMDRITAAIHLNTTVRGLAPRPDGIEATLSGTASGGASSEGGGREWTERFDAVLVAVGRAPNSGIGGLERTRIERDARGFIRVDAQRRTAEPAVFAVGDVTGEPMLAHKAFAEAGVAVETIAGRDAAFAPRAIPAVVFTDPEVAWCGLTETQAWKDGRGVRVARFPWGASGRAMTLDRPEGVTKLLIDPGTEQVLGVGIAGVGAGELIAEGVLAIEQGVRASELAHAIHPHPTLSETMGEAAEAFLGRSAHIYRPRR